jgi:predicted P-loop ATPase
MHADVCGWQLANDEFQGKIMRAPAGTEEWRALTDTDYMEIALGLERAEGGFKNGFASIPKELMRDCVAYVANVNAFDSAKRWLTNLPQHDGKKRVELSLISYFGAQDSEYVRAIGRYLWTALAGRTLDPGIKADMVPVATGAQGLRKSSTVAAIVVAPDYFTAVDLSRKDDDNARLMAGKQVGELDELRGLGTREAEAIKSFITRRFEEWVPKYYEMVRRYPRRIVFFGTSNQDDFLSDATGNRRWLPFRCGQCDPDALAHDRDQLWAEARDLFLQHGVMFEDAERLAGAEHAAFTEFDEWQLSVEDWLRVPDFNGGTNADRTHVTTREILRFVGVPDAQQTKLHQGRMKKILKRLGFKELSGRGGRRFELPQGEGGT